MQSFEIGDKVEITTVTYGYPLTRIGEVGVVSRVLETGYDVVFEGYTWHFGCDDRDGTIRKVKPAKVKLSAKKRPHGPQEYKGNGQHEWEAVTEDKTVQRLRVPGGWIYGDNGMYAVFVPVPDAVGYSV